MKSHLNFINIALITSIGFIAIFLGGCLNNDTYDTLGILQKDVQTIQDYLSNNGIPAQMDSVSGIFYEIHKNGAGYRPALSAVVRVHFSGYTLEGVKFIDNFSVSALEYTFGNAANTNGLTQGFDIGLSHLDEGDSATFYVPSPYGYQNNQTGSVPPNSILVYHTKFEGIKNLALDNTAIDQYIMDHNFTAKIDSIYGTRFVVHKAGSGSLPANGDYITTDYVGQFLDGTTFDSSYGSGGSLAFHLGSGEVVKGFDMGFHHLHLGDSATIFIPSVYGYGDQAVGSIPANSVLVMGVDFKQLNPAY